MRFCFEDSGAYYCVEPWWGIPDFADPARELKDKELIESLAVGESRKYTFSIEVCKG
jgi:galactose mutarotase-like enzyme